jgi:hypothetical protein
LAAGGIAYATIPGGSGTISGCYNETNGFLRVIDAEAGDACKNAEEPLAWNQQGPQGPPGDQGPPGPSSARVQGFLGLLVPATGAEVEFVGPILDIQPGNYVATGHVTFGSISNGTTQLNCGLSAGFHLPGVTLVTPDAGGSLTIGGGLTVPPATTGTLTIHCNQSRIATTSSVLANGFIQLIKVGTLN